MLSEEIRFYSTIIMLPPAFSAMTRLLLTPICAVNTILKVYYYASALTVLRTLTAAKSTSFGEGFPNGCWRRTLRVWEWVQHRQVQLSFSSDNGMSNCTLTLITAALKGSETLKVRKKDKELEMKFLKMAAWPRLLVCSDGDLKNSSFLHLMLINKTVGSRGG